MNLGRRPAGFIESALAVLVKRFRRAHLSAHAVSGQGKAVGIVDQAVENGVSQSRVADGFVPLIDGQLAGHDGGSAALPVFEDFQQIAAFWGGKDRQAPVVQDQ